MDKRTVDLAEQVGLFLLPTIRAAVATMVSEVLSGTTTKLADLAQLVERVSGEAKTMAESQQRASAELRKDIDLLNDQMVERLAEASVNLSACEDHAEETRKDLSARIDAIVTGIEQKEAGLRAEQSTLNETVERLSLEQVALGAEVQMVKAGAADSLKELETRMSDNVTAAVNALMGEVTKGATKLRASIDELQQSQEQTATTVAELPLPPSADEVARSVLATVEPKLADSISATKAELSIAVLGEVERAVAALPPAKDGQDGKDGAPGKEGPPGPRGYMLQVDPYLDGELYERLAIVAHGGGTWQATRRTKSAPQAGSPDWQAVAVGVAAIEAKASDDLRSFEIAARLSDGTEVRQAVEIPALIYRGVYDATEQYRAQDVVTHAGATWVFRGPQGGEVPGVPGKSNAWQLMVKRGQDGRPGKDGADGVQFQAGYAGEYEEGKSYSKNTLVEYSNSLWMAKRPTKDRPPYMTGASNEHWLRVR